MNPRAGEPVTAELVAAGEVERAATDQALVTGLLELANRHLASAEKLTDSDPGGAHTLLFMAAHRAVVAISETAGLRTTDTRRALTAYETARAQLDPPNTQTLDAYAQMYHRRNDAEYCTGPSEPITPDEIHANTKQVQKIIELARQVANG